MSQQFTANEEAVLVTADDMAEYFRLKFWPSSEFRVYKTNAGGLVVLSTATTALTIQATDTKLLAAAPAEIVHVITAADRDFLKAMKISIQHE